MAFDGAGNLYVSDCWAARVFVIDRSGAMKLVAGSGGEGFAAGYSGDQGPASKAEVYCPIGLVVDRDGNLLVADDGNNRIRRVAPDGLISTLAGTGPVGTDRGAYTGDGGPATSARLHEPVGVALAADGALYFADSDNNAVRKVDGTGTITTIAGNGIAGFAGDAGPATKAELNHPESLAFDRSGNLYVSDSTNNRVRKIGTDGTITTVAGNGAAGYAGDRGSATEAELGDPYTLAFDTAGDLYVAQPDGNRIRRIDTTGTITTFAGTGTAGRSGDGGPANMAQLDEPHGLTFDSSGNLYIADSTNHRIRMIDKKQVITTFARG